MKKNKKGFTLVELLAVIVILAVISVLAFNKIKEVMKQNNEKSVIANAKLYIKAINAKLDIADVDNSFPDGVYFTTDIIGKGVSLSGTMPDAGSVYVSNGNVEATCLKYGKYVYRSIGSSEEVDKKQVCFNNDSRDFSYTGNVQEFKATKSGDYIVELWGAAGATNDFGGKGAYTKGTIHLNKDDKLYVYVGGQSTSNAATFNGGGSCGGSCTAGGGATDVRLVKGSSWDEESSLVSRIMVAAGGAGYNTWGSGYKGGDGGTFKGLQGGGDCLPTGGTQNSGGISCGNVAARNGSFGKGATGESYGGGGAGGYYGGAAGITSSTGNGGAGGSSFISGHIGCLAIASASEITPKEDCYTGTDEEYCSIHYSNKKFTNTVMKAGNEEMPVYEGSGTMTGNLGPGHARISYGVPNLTLTISYSFDYNNDEQMFTAPIAGKYKLEIWGAQGGDASEPFVGGFGGYSTGTMYLHENDVLYINVGGRGGSNPNTIETVAGGYNGGGSSYRNINGDSAGSMRGSGGGATSITKTSGLLSTFSENISDVIIVAGGGGGASSWSTHYGYPGHGGGYLGTNGTISGDGSIGYGASQTEGGNTGGIFGKGGDAIQSPGWGNSGGSGGGGGFYGGGRANNNAGAGGGSGYIGNSLLKDKKMYCYNCTESDDPDTKTTTTTCAETSPTPNCAKKGNGYAKITYIP